MGGCRKSYLEGVIPNLRHEKESDGFPRRLDGLPLRCVSFQRGVDISLSERAWAFAVSMCLACGNPWRQVRPATYLVTD